MFITLSCSLYFVLLLQAAAVPSITRYTSNAPYSLPMANSNAKVRAAAILNKREGFLYGPSICGNVSYWPTGSLGNSTTKSDFDTFTIDSEYIQAAIKVDEARAIETITAAGCIKQLSDYEVLYKDQWKESMPAGLDTGIFSNYTNDLMFSMERLSINPYSIKRLNPSLDSLHFQVEDTIVSEIANTTLESLFSSGNLFYVDHRSQAALQRTERYAAACDAYFYIHPGSGDFLPLAIRTNVGTALVYTPVDSANDWLLAKIMFNVNDFWQSQWYHLSGTHNVIEIVYEAAYRTLSDEHPVMALLERLTLELFAYRQVALEVLVNSGGYVDRLFAFGAVAATQTTSDLYNSGVSGAFQANYFYDNLASRGLINSAFGAKIKFFPFFEDASVIHTAIQGFMTAFVDSYYITPSAFTQDQELQAWIAESGPAKIIDFPQSIDRGTLINILTHIAYLGSAAHHTLNTNDISEASGSLPFHPFSIYQPIPTAKGVTDIVSFLPNVTQSISQIVLTAAFARPEFVKSNRSMSHMFNDTAMLARMNKEVAEAATLFQAAMQELSNLVSSRNFSAEGLSQGMPFIWKALDPEKAPYYLTI